MGRRMTLSISSLVAVLAASVALAQSYTPAFRPATLDDKPAGAPNEVMVLGTPHLSQLPESFRPEMVDPLVDRLVDWAPTAVATEDTPGLVCDAMRRMPSRHRSPVARWGLSHLRTFLATERTLGSPEGLRKR